jgi:hypothetical protein
VVENQFYAATSISLKLGMLRPFDMPARYFHRVLFNRPGLGTIKKSRAERFRAQPGNNFKAEQDVFKPKRSAEQSPAIF